VTDRYKEAIQKACHDFKAMMHMLVVNFAPPVSSKQGRKGKESPNLQDIEQESPFDDSADDDLIVLKMKFRGQKHLFPSTRKMFNLASQYQGRKHYVIHRMKQMDGEKREQTMHELSP
jgi:hypothetical protein